MDIKKERDKCKWGLLSGMLMVLAILLYEHFIHRHRFIFVQIQRFLITQQLAYQLF